MTCLYTHLAHGSNHNQIRSEAHPQPYLHNKHLRLSIGKGGKVNHPVSILKGWLLILSLVKEFLK